MTDDKPRSWWSRTVTLTYWQIAAWLAFYQLWGAIGRVIGRILGVWLLR